VPTSSNCAVSSAGRYSVLILIYLYVELNINIEYRDTNINIENDIWKCLNIFGFFFASPGISGEEKKIQNRKMLTMVEKEKMMYSIL